MQTMQSGHSRLQLMGFVTAGAMLLAGLCLVEPSLAASLALSGYELTGAFLIVQAAVLGVVSLPGESARSNVIALVLSRLALRLAGIGFGSLDLFLAGSSVFEGQYILLLFALPGVLLWVNSIGDTASENSKDDIDDTLADESKIVVTPDEGRPDPVGTLRSNAWSSAYSGLMIVAMAAILIPGTFLFRLLQRELIERQPVGLDGLVRALSSLSGPVLWMGLALGVVIPLVLLLFGAGSALSQWLVNRRHARAARDLTGEQVAFVERAYAAVHALATQRNYERWSLFALIGALVGGLSYLAVMALSMRLIFRAAAAAYIPEYAERLPWFFFHHGTPASVAPGIAFIAAGTWAFYHVACRLSEPFAQFMAWWHRSNESDGLSLRQTLVRFVRTGKLRASQTFSASAFLQELSGWRAPYAFGSAALTGALALYLLAHDLRDYQLFTDAHIEVVDYWSGEPRRLRYADVEWVNLTCFVRKRNDVDVSYQISLPGGHLIDLFHKSDFPDRLADYERINRNLQDAGARFTFGRFREGCMDKLSADYDEETVQRVKALFHLNAWRESEAAIPE